MKEETKIEAIKRLIDEEKELYLVENYITVDDQISTNLWNLYNSKENALRWIELCEEYHSEVQMSYKGSHPDEPIDDFEGHFVLELRYTDWSTGREVLSVFVYQKIK